jgi:hypothetical protein
MTRNPKNLLLSPRPLSLRIQLTFVKTAKHTWNPSPDELSTIVLDHDTCPWVSHFSFDDDGLTFFEYRIPCVIELG